jgi:hypothetical protein
MSAKPCVFCGKVNDFLMACDGVCLRCHDRLQAEHGLYIGPQSGIDTLRAQLSALRGELVAAYTALDKCNGFALQGIHESDSRKYCKSIRSVCLAALARPEQPEQPEQETLNGNASPRICSGCHGKGMMQAGLLVACPECGVIPKPAQQPQERCEDCKWAQYVFDHPCLAHDPARGGKPAEQEQPAKEASHAEWQEKEEKP